MTHAPTLSGLHLLAACPGSASLPRQRRSSGAAAALGTATHRLIQWRIEDYQPSLAEIAETPLQPEDAGRLAFLAEHLRLPVPSGALAEVALGLFPNGSVHRIEGGAGSYPDVGQVLSGTLDAMWAEPEPLMVGRCHKDSTLWVVDWKTGDDENVVPIARNWQLRAGALLAARWTGATGVIPAICFINAAECAQALREGRVYEGRWEAGAPLDAAALNAIEVELRAVLSAARGESEDGDEGLRTDLSAAGDRADGSCATGPGDDSGDRGRLLPPGNGRGDRELDRQRGEREWGAGHDRASVGGPLILGPHCEHCPARAHCPEFGAAARQLVEQAQFDPRSPVLMTPADRAFLAALLPALRATLDRAEEALRAGGPVELADGRVYGPALEPVMSYRTAPTFDALAAIVGEERANDAAVYTTSSIKQALAAAGAPRGAFGRLRAEIEAAGGMVPAAHVVWRKRWPAVLAEGVKEDGTDERGQEDGGRIVEDDRRAAHGEAEAAHAEPGLLDEAAPVVPTAYQPSAPGSYLTARAACPDCGTPGIAVNRKGGLRKHQLPGTALRCRPGLPARPVPRPLGQPSPAPPAGCEP